MKVQKLASQLSKHVMHAASFCAFRFDWRHHEPLKYYRTTAKVMHAGAWSVTEKEWGSPHNCPPSNMKPGQAVLEGSTM